MIFEEECMAITNRTVAVCDILGFTKLVQSKPLNDVVNIILGEFRKILYRITQHKEPPQNISSLRELKEQSRIGIGWFSDTVLFYSLEDSEEDCRTVIESTAWLIFFTMLNPPLRVRAAVSYGEVFVDESNGLFIGTPLIEAYKLQELQNWSGGALAPSVIKRIPKDYFGAKVYDWYFTDYPVPLKRNNPPFNDIRWAIDWTRGIHGMPDPWSFPWSPSSDEPTENDRNELPDKVAKWENTRNFHTAKCEFCRNSG